MNRGGRRSSRRPPRDARGGRAREHERQSEMHPLEHGASLGGARRRVGIGRVTAG